MKTITCCALAFSFLLASCGTSENVKTEEQKDYTNELLSLSSSLDSLEVSMENRFEITMEKIADMKMESTTIYLSTPDSMGRQYPIKQNVTTINKQEGEKVESSGVETAMIERLLSVVDSLRDALTAKTEKREKVIEVSWWDMNKYRVLIAIPLLAISIYAIRRFLLQRKTPQKQ